MRNLVTLLIALIALSVLCCTAVPSAALQSAEPEVAAIVIYAILRA